MLQRKSSNLKGEQCMRKQLPKTLRELIFACLLSAAGRYSGGSYLFHCTIGNVYLSARSVGYLGCTKDDTGESRGNCSLWCSTPSLNLSFVLEIKPKIQFGTWTQRLCSINNATLNIVLFQQKASLHIIHPAHLCFRAEIGESDT